jgi:hypothetical protein
MSWSLTIDDLENSDEIPEHYLEKLGGDNPVYRSDAAFAYDLAKAVGLVSATISGGRTPHMYGGPDTVTISVVGFDSHKEGHAVARIFNETMRQRILDGPDTFEVDYTDWHND